MEIKKIGVFGAGTMGNGIAQVVAHKGYDVSLMDLNKEILERGLESIKKSMNRLLKAGKIGEEEINQTISKISTSVDVEQAAKDVDVVIEAIPEDLQLKKTLFKKLDEICQSHTILATNTSQLSITSIGSVTRRRNKVIGMHWFNPPVIMRLIEIVRGIETDDETVKIIEDLSHKLGKETVICKDSQGFIASRALAAFMNECMKILEEGIASKEDIDKAIKLGLNHPMGPFELGDYTGLDIILHVAEGLEEALGERFKPCQTLRKLVEASHLGRKTGKGFYSYSSQ